MHKLTKAEKRMRRKYTVSRRCGGSERACGLKVDQQSFLFAYRGDKEDVAWMRDMLAVALARVVKHEKKT